MASYQIQFQTVLFKNKIPALMRSLENLANALHVFEKRGEDHIDLTVVYGDASPSPIFADDDVQSIRERFSGVFTFTYTYFNENTGTAKGHNRMAKDARCDFLMVMNPDILVNPSIFSQLLAPYKSSEQVGLTEARQTPLEHAKTYNTVTGETSWASTACVLIRKSAYDKVNGFDEDTFFMYCDDVDFSWLLRLAGYKVIYCPNAAVFHDKSISVSAQWQPTASEVYYSAEAALLMAYKWSANDRLRMLLNRFEKGEQEAEHKAAKVFRDREAQGKLPAQLDPKHRVADFTHYGYGEMRFIY